MDDLFKQVPTYNEQGDQTGIRFVPVDVDIDEIVRELAGCVLHGAWGTGCDFDYAEARAIILRIGGSKGE